MRNLAGSLGLVVLVVAVGTCWAGSRVVDHRDVDIARLTEAQINRAKANLHIAYGHTSHGSQLTDGMSGLVGFANGGGKGLNVPENVFAWNYGGHEGALDLRDGVLCNDVGYYPDWVVCTSNYLNDPANADVNVILWSWCGQMSGKYSGGTLTNEYLAPMAAFERNYPNVTFVYMTGHVDIWNDANNKAACEVIRDWCSVSNRVLYDFNDIEHYNPDGTYFEFVGDDCGVYNGAGGTAIGNWATEWQATHTEGMDWYDCNAAHSVALNGNLKAYAAWALWCQLAADLDRDDLADEWEERHGGIQLFGGGTNDFDADGLTDWEEYVLDSAPTNITPHFGIVGLAPTNATTVEFLSSTGRVYSLRACDNLVAGEWHSVTSRPGTGDRMSLTDANSNSAIRAYGVAVSLQD